jgi:polyphosphate kinase 2 (PPK2 family)
MADKRNLNCPAASESILAPGQDAVARRTAAGEMVPFERSWYNRAGIERVMGFCTDEEYREFSRSCPEFERMLIRSEIIVMKYWFFSQRGRAERAVSSQAERSDQTMEAQPNEPGVLRKMGESWFMTRLS